MEIINDVLLIGLGEQYAEGLSELLRSNGITVYTIEDPINAFETLVQKPIDLCVVHYDQRKIKWSDYISLVAAVNPLVLSAVVFDGDEEVELEILESHADLHISEQKSLEFSTKLILSNLETLNTKVGRVDKRSIYLEEETAAGLVAIYLDSMKVTLNGVGVDVTATEFQILTYLIHEKHRIVSREDLLRLMYGEIYENKDFRNVDVHIKNLRSKIGYNAIQSIRGYGYRWIENDASIS